MAEPSPRSDLARVALAEALGTGLLVAIVVGSGIAAERLLPREPGLQLLVNALATGAGLLALIAALASVSGAHLNPVVTIASAARGATEPIVAVAAIAAQVVGAALGCVVANLMYELDPIQLSQTTRSSGGLWLGEVVATFGLVVVVLGLVHARREVLAPAAVAGYVTAAYWFTSSTSFANPAVTIGRTLTDTFSGIAPASAPAFVACQLLGAALAVATARVLFPADDHVADRAADLAPGATS